MKSFNKPTICLNMIVKNESHIIEETLEKLTTKIQFDYWCISDTGSTDETKEIIQTFFDKKQIPGILVNHEWKDFAYNRTKALECAFNKTDYLLVFDADDELCGNFQLPLIMNKDGYRLNFGDEHGVSYNRVLLVNNRKKWCYKSVLHEYIECLDPICQYETITGNYYVISGRKGARSMDPDKYLKDAIVLKNAHAVALVEKDDLYLRYAFYCANSFFDCKHYTEAIEWYKITLSQTNWVQEKYISCLRIGEAYNQLLNAENGLPYLVKSYKYDKTRVECIYNLIEYYCNNEMYDIASLYYSLIKSWYENQYLHIVDFSQYLFLIPGIYNFYLPYYMCAVYEKLQKYSDMFVLFEIIFTKKFIPGGEQLINRLFIIFNISVPTFIEHSWDISRKLSFLTKMLSYIEIIKEKNIPFNDFHIQNIQKLLEKIRPQLITYSPNIPNIKSKKKDIQVMLTITTCKRFDLFSQTINSILKTWLDIDKIDYFYCIDDNSSLKDQEKMKIQYPFFKFYFKNESEKGHRQSMNIIWKKLKKYNPKYWIHLEDDWLFFKQDNYVQKSINILELPICISNKVSQVLFNRNYAEQYIDWNINGGTLISPGVLAHVKTDQIQGINCAYWPHYSFRPSMVKVETILQLGDYNTPNIFFERDYANCYFENGYTSVFYNGICSTHIGKLTTDKTGTNAYTLNELTQFNELSQSNESQTEKKNDKKNDDIQTSLYTIKIVNLKRREDRKEKTIKMLSLMDISNYEFIEAVDGSSIPLTYEIIDLFRNNDFGNRKGYIGCALSHYNIWKQLLISNEEFNVIFEDDITEFADDFKKKLNTIVHDINITPQLDYLLLGYFLKQSHEHDKYKTFKDSMAIVNLNKETYIGGFFGYIITKSGAKKMCDYIEQNGICHGIDYLIKLVPNLNCYNIQPHIVHSEIVNYSSKNKDSDIQLLNDCFDFNVGNINDWKFIKGMDSCEGDEHFIQNTTLQSCLAYAHFNPSIVAFNTLGFLKNMVNPLSQSIYFRDNDGIYIKKQLVNKTKYTRVKLLCNWCSSRELCLEWNNLTKGDFIWNNIQLTWEDTNIDYYIIINMPINNEYYEPSKTIVFQMEPWCYDESQNWGVKTWGEWAKPNESTFLHVRSHEKYYNNCMWQLKSTYTELKNNPILKYNHNFISSICSSKYVDPGHIKRVDFLKFIEQQNDEIVKTHIYSSNNIHNFENYVGQTIPDKDVGILNYKYYFMCENNQEHNYITEKLWEPILCECLCFYWGCPNLSDYINPKAYVELDMNDFDKSFQIIKSAIKNNLWEERLPIIREEKQKVLDYYNFCPTVERIINNHEKYTNGLIEYNKIFL